MIKPLAFASFANYYLEGDHGVIVRTRSYSSDTIDPKVKHHSRANFVLAELEAADVDLMPPHSPRRDGNLTEGVNCNLFLVKDGALKTPTDRSILQGVSRSVVIDVAGQLGIPVVEEDLQPYDVYTADEVFFSRTSPRIVRSAWSTGDRLGTRFPDRLHSSYWLLTVRWLEWTSSTRHCTTAGWRASAH